MMHEKDIFVRIPSIDKKKKGELVGAVHRHALAINFVELSREVKKYRCVRERELGLYGTRFTYGRMKNLVSALDMGMMWILRRSQWIRMYAARFARVRFFLRQPNEKILPPLLCLFISLKQNVSFRNNLKEAEFLLHWTQGEGGWKISTYVEKHPLQ